MVDKDTRTLDGGCRFFSGRNQALEEMSQKYIETTRIVNHVEVARHERSYSSESVVSSIHRCFINPKNPHANVIAQQQQLYMLLGENFLSRSGAASLSSPHTQVPSQSLATSEFGVT